MRRGQRTLVELTAWLTQNLAEFFAIVPARQEFETRLVTLSGRDVDPSFAWADIYNLQFLPDVLKAEPRGILPPDYDPQTEPLVSYTFAMWSRQGRPMSRDEIMLASAAWALRLSDGPAPEFADMRRHILPDLFGRKSEGVARRRFARLADVLSKRIPGHEFQHFTTVPSGDDLVSVFVDLDSLERVAHAIK